VQRLPRLRPTAPRARWLLVAAGLALGAPQAGAQVTGSFSDPLTPQLTSDPADPPRFEKADGRSLAQADQPTTFAPASGAGVTGFDSTNARKKAKPDAPSGVRRFETGTAALQGRPPYQQPIPPLPGDPLAAAPGDPDAAAAGTPPIDFGPVRKPKKRRTGFDEPIDPYEPLGVRAGAFILYPAIELIGGYDSNPDRVEDGEGAAFGTVAPELQLQSDWSRHELNADLRGSYTAYSPDSTPTLNRPYVDGTVDGRIDVARDTHVELGGRVLVSTDNPGSPNLQAGLADLPVYTTFGGSGGIRQGFNRLEVTLKADVERTVYQESILTDGSTASNDDRNYNQYGGILRGSYEMTPGVKPFAEFGTDQRVHDLPSDSSGYRRDSTGWTGKVGTTFELSRLLTGEIALGYTTREYDDPRLEMLEGFVGDASLIWTADALNTVKLTAASSVGESTQPGVSGVLYRDVGVQWDHSFRRWLIGTVKVGVGLDDYVGDGRQDQRYTAAVGLTYKLNRWLQLKGEFRQDWLNSNVPGNDYTASTVLLGIRLQQ
jgi:hypothetical protein